MMKDCLIVTDLDGTLLNSNHEVSEQDCRWIDTFKYNNGKFTIATGRMTRTVKQFIKKLKVDMPVITYNGAQIFCPVNNKVVYQKSLMLSEELIEEIAHASDSFAEILIFYGDQVYALEKGKLIEEYERKENVTCSIIRIEEIPLHVIKVIVLSNDQPKLLQFENMCMETFHRCNLIYSERNYLEILPTGISKGEALKVLKERYALGDAEVIAFGNNLNDISLLKAADVGIAVKNSEDQLSEISDCVSAYSNDEGAVGRHIELLLAQYEQKSIGV
ncbi:MULTISPECIES: HAD family hydrolase [unclassified Sporosarcina]|uniref:HAD family hydrolase n=1 Tax=unclassified Sporosarcina TaxID=2647733 RepID=UPI00203B20CC|nr:MULTISPECIES: HAD family hydrolase [unclassified Sporosarcina]GKV65109.1 phosphatase [Sporosarcina sp. NCCP-2331]GLB55233.1 phosphatase [Sporosarcina sp. NCCP-2378]